MPPPLSLFLAWGTTLDWSCRLVRHLFFESELYWVSAERDAWSRPLVRRLASGTAPLLCDSAARSATHDRARFKPLSLLHIANPPWLCGVWRSGTLGRARLHAVASLERRRCHCDSAGTPTLDLARLCAVSSLERRRCCCDSAGSTTSSRSLRISDDASPGVNSMTGRSRGLSSNDSLRFSRDTGPPFGGLLGGKPSVTVHSTWAWRHPHGRPLARHVLHRLPPFLPRDRTRLEPTGG
jgi:hypothetical protein